jgi:hypothetical protein
MTPGSIASALAMVFAIPALAMAQPQSFDVYTYEAPPGYTIKTAGESAELAKIDHVKRSYCQIALYRAQTSLGTPELDLENEWKAVVLKMLRVTSSSDAGALPLPQAPESIMRGAQGIDSNGNKAVSALFVVRFEQRYVGVVVNAPHAEAFQACQEDATKVVFGLRMAHGVSAPAPISGATAQPPASSGLAAPSSPVGNGTLAGVWEKTVSSRPATTYNAFTKQWETNFAAAGLQFRSARRFRIESNGQYVYELDHEDYNRSERSLVIERGTYTVADGVIRFQPKEAQQGTARRGQQVPLGVRAVPAAYARRFSIGEHPLHKESPGLQIQGEDGSWETFRALR